MPNQLYLSLLDTAGTVTLDHPIPAQTITLKSASVHFNNNANLTANAVVFFDVPWLDANQVTSNIKTGYRLPLLSGNDGGGDTMTTYNPNISMDIHQAIPSHFQYKITNSQGVVYSDTVVTEIHLVFEFNNVVITG